MARWHSQEATSLGSDDGQSSWASMARNRDKLYVKIGGKNDWIWSKQEEGAMWPNLIRSIENKLRSRFDEIHLVDLRSNSMGCAPLSLLTQIAEAMRCEGFEF